jgi:hypothetical protein
MVMGMNTKPIGGKENMKKYQVICMSFDGEYKRESAKHETVEDAWEYANDLGSKWYFYPFYFVVSGNTIKDAPDELQNLIGKRISTAARIFKTHSEKTETQGMDVEQFMYSL